jgi:hypothetical protein
MKGSLENPQPTNEKTQLVADDTLVIFTIELLKEMEQLEAGWYLRDLGYNFPVTMDAIYKATGRKHWSGGNQ